MILSFHLVELSPSATLAALRTRPAPAKTAGLIWWQKAAAVPLAAGIFPPPRPTGLAVTAAWTDDAALDNFLATDPVAEPLSAGWNVRLEPLGAVGDWPVLPGLYQPRASFDDGEPVAVLTMGKLVLRRAVGFFKASGAAERQAVAAPGLLLSTGLARPPRLVASFTVWRNIHAMRAYAQRTGGAHLDATRAHHQRRFHHESLFARFRPYHAHGTWQGFTDLGPTVAHAGIDVQPACY